MFYSQITFNRKNRNVSAYRTNSILDANQYEKCDSIVQFINKVIECLNKPKPVEIKLNDNYTAIVTPENVQVNCQEFTQVKIKELYDASINAQSKH